MIFLCCLRGNLTAQTKVDVPPAPGPDAAIADPGTPGAGEPYDESHAVNDEEAARRMVQEIRSLVLPQQKEMAEEMIRKYPNTRLSKIAEQLLEEYRMYDALMEADQAKVEAETAAVRAFWKTVYPGGLNLEGMPTRITNLTDEPVLYQIHGPETAWSGPHNLRVNESHILKYPATFRRVTKDGAVEYSLRVGKHYVFRRLTPDAVPQLFEARE